MRCGLPIGLPIGVRVRSTLIFTQAAVAARTWARPAWFGWGGGLVPRPSEPLPVFVFRGGGGGCRHPDHLLFCTIWGRLRLPLFFCSLLANNHKTKNTSNATGIIIPKPHQRGKRHKDYHWETGKSAGKTKLGRCLAMAIVPSAATGRPTPP